VARERVLITVKTYPTLPQRFHSVGPNPWLIIGVLPIPHEPQMELL